MISDRNDGEDPRAEDGRGPDSSGVEDKPGSFFNRTVDRATLLDYSDVLLAMFYFLFTFIAVLPGIRHGYDYTHHPPLLMAGVRILDGQVPFVDFYPWYGPLYHYFTALWFALLGPDILTVKLFLVVISPLLSMALFIASLRFFRIPWQGRLFAVLGSALWGVDRLFHSGSTRTMLGLFLIGLWAWGIKKPWANRLRITVFPSAFVMFLYSPDVGIYLGPVAAVLVFIDLVFISKKAALKSGLFYGGGLAVTLAGTLALYFGTEFFKNYLDFFQHTSKNMVWAYGTPLPEARDFIDDPRLLIFFLPLFAIVSGLLYTLWKSFKENFMEERAWVPLCALFAAALYSSTYLRSDPTHLLFSMPPVLALLAFFFALPARLHWRKVALLLLLVLFIPFKPDLFGKMFPFFSSSRLDASYWLVTANPRYEWPTGEEWGRIYITQKEKSTIDKTAAFYKAHEKEGVIFPLFAYESYRIGVVPALSFNDMFWSHSEARTLAMKKYLFDEKAGYVAIDRSFLLAPYTNYDLDYIYDTLCTWYELIETDKPLLFYRRREEPVRRVELIDSRRDKFVLDRENDFSLEIDLPEGLDPGYVEVQEKFIYDRSFMQRFSMPIVEIHLDGKEMLFPGTFHGALRINNTPEGGYYRAYVHRGAKKLTLKVTFPGVLNFKPRSVEMWRMKFYKFNGNPQAPYFRMDAKRPS